MPHLKRQHIILCVKDMRVTYFYITPELWLIPDTEIRIHLKLHAERNGVYLLDKE